MKKILSTLIALISVNLNAGTYIITNNAETGIGTFSDIYAQIIANNDSTPNIEIHEFLSGSVYVDQTYIFKGLRTLSISGNSNANLESKSYLNLRDNVLFEFEDIQTVSISNLVSGSGLVKFNNIGVISINDSELYWTSIIREYNELSVNGGSSGGFNTRNGFVASFYDHRISAGAYFGIFDNVDITTINKCRIGIQDNRLAHSLTWYGLKFMNCDSSTISIQNNEIVSIFNQSLGDSTGYGIQIKDCYGDITIDDNHFGIDSSETVVGSIFDDIIRIENSRGVNHFEIKNNVFASSFENAINFKNVSGTPTISGNRFGKLYSSFFDDAILLEKSDSVIITNNHFQSVSNGAIKMESSSYNTIKNNYLGFILNLDSASFEKGIYTGSDGFFMDENSSYNNLSGNYSKGHSGHAYHNEGTFNKFLNNYTACNDSGSFYTTDIDPTLQNQLETAILLLNLDNGEPLSLIINGLSIPDGYKATIFKEGDCADNTLAGLRNTFIDSVSITNGTMKYVFQNQGVNKTLNIDTLKYFVVIENPQGQLVGITKNSVENVVTNTIEVDNNMIQIGPNPVSNQLNIQSSETLSGVVTSINGQILMRFPTLPTYIPTNNLKEGIYYLQVVGTDKTSTVPFIKNK